MTPSDLIPTVSISIPLQTLAHAADTQPVGEAIPEHESGWSMTNREGKSGQQYNDSLSRLFCCWQEPAGRNERGLTLLFLCFHSSECTDPRCEEKTHLLRCEAYRNIPQTLLALNHPKGLFGIRGRSLYMMAGYLPKWLLRLYIELAGVKQRLAFSEQTKLISFFFFFFFFLHSCRSEVEPQIKMISLCLEDVISFWDGTPVSSFFGFVLMVKVVVLSPLYSHTPNPHLPLYSESYWNALGVKRWQVPINMAFNASEVKAAAFDLLQLVVDIILIHDLPHNCQTC